MIDPNAQCGTAPLKLVYVLLYFPYFTETFVANEIRELQRTGHDVRIVSLLDALPGALQSHSRELANDTVYAAPLTSARLWRAQWWYIRRAPQMYGHLLGELMTQPLTERPLRSVVTRFRIFLKSVEVAHALRNESVDVYHSHFAWISSAAARICAKLHHKPFTFTAHAYDVFSPKRDMLPLVTSDAARIVAVSDFNRVHMVSAVGCHPNAISVVRCGVDTARPAARLRSGERDNTPFRILSVGSLVEKKGHHDLISACSMLARAGFHFTCTIVGAGPRERALKKQIERLHLQQCVHLTGAIPQQEVFDALDHHDLFVLACVVMPDGNRDGIPVALMEAMHAGVPVISTNVSGIPELVRNDDTGVLVAPQNPAALAEAIMALASDAARRSRLVANARALVEEQFALSKAAAQLTTVFAQVTHEHAVRAANRQTNRAAHTGAARSQITAS